jgi:SAM-dependent methyltransferase
VDTAVYSLFRERYEANWYLAAREDVLAAFIARFCPTSGGDRVLDLGAGTGRILRRIATAPRRAIAVEDDAELASQARARYELHTVRADLSAPLPLRDHCAYLLLLLDVLEHVEDDGALLREVFRLLRPGGAAVITVPAFQALWSAHDEAHHHKRRYSKTRLRRVIAAAGLRCQHVTYYNAVLFPLVAGVRIVDRLRRRPAGADYDRAPAALGRVLGWAFSQERRLVTRWRLPVGVSLLVVASREP